MVSTLRRILSFRLTLRAHSVAALLTWLPLIATITWRVVDEATSSLPEFTREERSTEDRESTDGVIETRCWRPQKKAGHENIEHKSRCHKYPVLDLDRDRSKIDFRSHFLKV